MKKDRIEEMYGELEAFSKEPPKELWDNIEARLHPKKKKRRVLFLWGSAAAVLVILFGYMIINSSAINSKSINEITDIEQPENDDIINEPNKKTNAIKENVNISQTSRDSLEEDKDIIKESLKKEGSLQQLTERHGKQDYKRQTKNNSNYKKIAEKEDRQNYNKSYVQNKLKQNKDKANTDNRLELKQKHQNLITLENKKQIVNNDSIYKNKESTLLDFQEKLVAENESIKDSINSNTGANSKWFVEVLGGLSNTTSNASIQGTDINTTSQNGFVYVFKVGYSISDRVTVKSGIGKNVLGQEINNIQYAISNDISSDVDFQGIVSDQSVVLFVSQDPVTDISSFENGINQGTFQQQFDYIQVPIEVSYNLLREQKYNISLGVGGNINFLTDNKAFLDNAFIGETLDVNSTIYGVTINSNISYEFVKKMTLFLEPSYNYFDKPIDNKNQTFNNTQLRVLFGLRYKL